MLLNCHTCYSMRYGTLSIEQLLQEVKKNGYDTFVLSDINNTSAIIDTVKQAEEFGIKVIFGIDFRNNIQQQYIGIANNNEGVRELNEHLSGHLHSGEAFSSTAPEFNHAYIVYPWKHYSGWKLKENEYVGVSMEDLKQFRFSKIKTDPKKTVVLHSVSFNSKKGFNAHRLLRAIDENTILSKLPLSLQGDPAEMMIQKSELLNVFSAYPEMICNTEHILNQCSIEIQYGKYANKNLKYYSGTLNGDVELLRKKAMEGLSYRFSTINATILDRMEKEISIVQQMDFTSYFLIMWDIINYARHKNYYYVGRGSGSNSLLAYLLRITDVDPLELDLYFERFINLYRTNPPDFDIDFSWTDRDDMTDYIFNRFGKNGKAALLGTYSTFQNSAVTRELGKVFGLPPAEIDQLQDERKHNTAGKLGQMVIDYGKWIHGFPSHVSIHSSGILISEKPITTYSATFMPPKGYPTTHFSMLEAEDIGLYKFDILSQRGLGKIKDTIDTVKETKGVEIDIHDMKTIMSDEKIKDQLHDGKAIGCFYVESPGMRMLLKKLQADDYLRLVAASSIIRPGVSKSGMMREYIMRFRNKELREKARKTLPELYDILEETYGVMVYQEDVIKVAHLFAGLTLAEADCLRRGMSWKFKQRNEFFTVQKQFFDNCKEKGYPEKVTTDIWNQIESFANFAFSKGHSASYAVESYQALYLKAHYPIEYMMATVNNGGGFYRMETYLHEARLHGATIERPCINRSSAESCINGKSIYLGFSLVSELENTTILEVLAERNKNGPFNGLFDFINRVHLTVEQLRLLIRCGAFRFTGKNKGELLWEAHLTTEPIRKQHKEQELFETESPVFRLPELCNNWLDDAFDDMELLGFTMELPFFLLRDGIPVSLKANQLKENLGKTVTVLGYLINTKRTDTSRGERMYFGTFLDTNGDWIDTVHFPPSAKAFPFKGSGCYLITGKVTQEFDFYSIEVSKQERLPYFDRTARTDKAIPVVSTEYGSNQ